MKVYLAGSMAGGRQFEKNLHLIARTLEKLGHVVLTKKNVVQMQPGYSNAQSLSQRKVIMKRDKKWLRSADAFIAEVSQYSHGVGYEHCYAEEKGKPVLLLRCKSLEGKRYSAFLDGTDYKEFMFAFYDKGNLRLILKRFFGRLV